MNQIKIKTQPHALQIITDKPDNSDNGTKYRESEINDGDIACNFTIFSMLGGGWMLREKTTNVYACWFAYPRFTTSQMFNMFLTLPYIKKKLK